MELSERHGFGFAMRAGLAHVSTPFVIVVSNTAPLSRAKLEMVQGKEEATKSVSPMESMARGGGGK